MPPSYQKVLSELYSLGKFGSRLSLSRIKKILFLLGNPQKNYRCILVGGSNGKGSTVEMIGSILSEEGYKTGTYFSPHIEEFSERIKINGKNASKREIVRAFLQTASVCRKVPDATFFEVVTAMALLIFKQRKVDFAVLEVGLGGRLDATNAVQPELSAITSISLEHTDILGKTIEKIAHEKCGIARRGKSLVCGRMSKEAAGAVKKECRKIGAIPIFTEEKVKISGIREKGGKYSFSASFRRKNYSLSLSAPGKFQISNSCVALVAASLLGAKKKAIEKGLAHCVPRYRLQKRGRLLLDCCHNPEAAEALAGELKRMEGRKILLFSAMKEKDYKSVFATLLHHFNAVVLTEVSLERGAKIADLKKAAKEISVNTQEVKNAKKALLLAKKLAGRKGTVVIAGSIYLLAELFGRDKILIGQ